MEELNINIPEPLQDILDIHCYEINSIEQLDDAYQVEIGKQTWLGLYIKELLIMENPTVSEFIKSIIEVCENFDPYEKATEHYTNCQGDMLYDKSVGTDIFFDDFLEDMQLEH